MIEAAEADSVSEDFVLDSGCIQIGVLEIWPYELHDVEASTAGREDEVAAHLQTGCIRLDQLFLGKLLHSEH